MTRTTLPDWIQKEIQKMPESGMGYHLINFTFSDGSTMDNVTVLNCTTADLPDQYAQLVIVSISRPR